MAGLCGHCRERAEEGDCVWALPTAQTHYWCLESAKQNEGETHRRTLGERQREREHARGCKSVCMYVWEVAVLGECLCVLPGV